MCIVLTKDHVMQKSFPYHHVVTANNDIRLKPIAMAKITLRYRHYYDLEPSPLTGVEIEAQVNPMPTEYPFAHAPRPNIYEMS